MITLKSFVFNPFQENTYVLSESSGQCMIIDPGCYLNEEKEALAAYVSDAGLTPVALINTHCHLDHIFGNAFVAEKYGLSLQMHELEKPILDFAPAAGMMYNTPFEPFTGPRNYLREGQFLSLGKIQFQILFTPGHSPGSISLYCKEQAMVLSGDVLFQRSIGRTDLPGGNPEVLLESIRTQLFTLPSETVVYSGHGPATTIGEERAENPFLNGEYPYFS